MVYEQNVKYRQAILQCSRAELEWWQRKRNCRGRRMILLHNFLSEHVAGVVIANIHVRVMDLVGKEWEANI